MAVMLNEATKLVFSRTLKEVTWSNSDLRREFDAHEIEALKDQPGKDIMVFDSGSLVSQLTQHGLIDEYQFVVMPVLIGGGLNLCHRSSPSPASAPS
jgi:dihydrofolate reductase